MLRVPSNRLIAFVTAWMLAGTIDAVAQYSQGAQSLRKTSELYDERGYAQSKAVTVDGRLSVAPSNGGLSYTYPVAQRTIHGFPITVTLNYCGSVAFTTYTNYDAGSLLAPHSRWARFSQNRPAWTIGVNGFAMQVLSFATSFHTDPRISALYSPSARGTFGDSDFVWTIDGYDVCNRMERLPIANAENTSIYTDVIRLLREDGSLLELVNSRPQTTVAAENRADLYTGHYRVNEANARGYGIVEFDSTLWPNHIRRYAQWVRRWSHPLYPFVPRRLRYFPGDGLEYRFLEWVAPFGLGAYADSTLRFGGLWAGPTIFYLEEIRSNDIVLTRASRSRHHRVSFDEPGRPHDDSTKGRALFTELENVCEVVYGRRSIAIHAGGRTVQAVFDTVTYSGAAGGADEMPLAKLGYMNAWSAAMARLNETVTPYRSFVGYVTRIIDPVGRITRFGYESYRRRYRGFGFPVEGGSVEVSLKNHRLVSVDEPTCSYAICYHTGDVRSLLEQGGCGDGPSDETMTYNTSSAGNPSALNNMVAMVRKHDHDGTRLLTDEYSVGDYNAQTGAFESATHRTSDHPAGTTKLLTYGYVRHALPPIHPFAPSPAFTELRTLREEASGTSTQTTTYYSRPTSSWYLWMPLTSTVAVNGVERTTRRMEYVADTVRRFDDALVTAQAGWEITRAVTKTYHPDGTLRLVDTVEYRHYPIRDTTVERVASVWKKIPSLQTYLRLRYELRDTAFVDREWEEVMFDPRVAVYRRDTLVTRVTRTPHFGIERRSVVADDEGVLLGGRVRLLRGDVAAADDPGSPALVMADSVIGRGGVAMLREAFRYGTDWTRNLPVERIDANGARTLIAYDSLRDGDGAAIALPRVGVRLTDDDSLRHDRLRGVDAALVETPIADARLVRRSGLGGIVTTDTLLSETERSFFAQASGVRDANGWIARSLFDPNGRLLATWLPGDYARVGAVDTFFYDGADSIDLYGSTSFTRRIDTLRCTITRTAPPTYPREIAEGTVPVITSDPSVLYAGLPVTVRERCPCADTASAASPKAGGGLMRDCSDTVTYAMVGEYPGYRGHLRFLLDRTSILRTLVRADSARLRMYVAGIEGECVAVRVTIAALGFTGAYVFNCPSIAQGSALRVDENDPTGLHSLTASVRRVRSLQGPYFDIRLDSVLQRITRMQVGDTFGVEIRVTSPGTGIRFASSSAAADMRPKLVVFGRFRTTSDTVDYTLAMRHVDDSLMTEVMAKTDDTKHTASSWSINRYHGDIRRSRIRHYFGADFRQRFSEIAIGEPGVPQRLDTVSFDYTGAAQRRVERDQNGIEVSRGYDGMGRPVEIRYPDGNVARVEYLAGTPADCGIAEAGQDFRGFCSAVITTDEEGVRRARYSDAFDRLRREVVALGGLNLTTLYDYDLLGRLTRSVNPNGDTTLYWYDDFGRVRYKWQPDLGVVSHAYDDAGNVRFTQSTEQAARGLITYTQYDDLGRVVLVGEATLGEEIARMGDTALRMAVTGLDQPKGARLMTGGHVNPPLELGRATEMLDGSRTYVGLGEELPVTVNRSLTMPPSPIMQPRVWSYARQTMVPMGCQLRPTALLKETHDPAQPYLSHPIGYYEPVTQPTATLMDFENVALHPHFPRLAMSHDELPSRVGSIWGGFPSTSDWNAIAPRGALRNQRGREAAVAWREHGGEPWHYAVFSYDERGRVEALLRYTENVGYDAVYYTYNALNQVTSVRVADPINHHVTWYGYDRNGRLDTMWTTLETGRGLGVGSLSRPSMPKRPDAPDVVFGYTRTGHVATMSYPPAAVSVAYAYTPRKWIDSLVATSTAPGATEPLFRERIGYDATGQMTTRTTQYAGLGETSHSYTYDAAQRLVQWSDGAVFESSMLDRVGNRQLDLGGRTWLRTEYTYQQPRFGPNRLLRRQSFDARRDWTAVDYTYDLDGAVTTRQRSDSGMGGLRFAPQETFTYSYRELLRRYTYNGPTHDWRYRYSPSGEREQKRLYPVSLENPSASNENPWAYYLLGASGEQLAVWHGREIYQTECANGVPVGTAWMYPVD